MTQQQEQGPAPLKDTIASEVLSAAMGGAFSSAVLYPLEVLKTRMQAAGDVKEEETDASSADHDGCHSANKSQNDKGDFSESSTSNKISPTSNKNMFEYATDLYRREGSNVFFKGMEISALQSAVEKACYFFAYSALKQVYAATVLRRTRRAGGRTIQSSPPTIPVFANLALACLAEWAHLPVTLPIDALTTAIQTSSSNVSNGAGQKKITRNDNAMALLMTMWKEDSVYKGIQAYYILCFKPALQYTIFEQVKAWILAGRRRPSQEQQQLSASEAFALGMFSRMVATLVVFPFVRAKVQLQSSPKGSSGSGGNTNIDSSTSLSIWSLLRTSYSTGGLALLYQGLGPELTRGVLSAALMMMVKERINGGVKRAIYRTQ